MNSCNQMIIDILMTMISFELLILRIIASVIKPPSVLKYNNDFSTILDLINF